MAALSEREVLASVRRLTVTRLHAWVESGWVQPAAGDAGKHYSRADVARLELLCTLTEDLEIDAEVVPVVLSLLDQLHGVRAALRDLVQAVEDQPEEVRAEIVRAYRARQGD